jgi:N-acetylglucosaminyldiphosphoundecaprenol N-acetyl-beta-D-mannosaminyltransferase
MTVAEAMGWRVFLFGGAPSVAAKAALRLRVTHPHLKVMGASAPQIDASDPESWGPGIEEVRAGRPDLVLVALGAPKQELWIHRAARLLRPAVLLGVGASLDFIAGTARRAPRWMSAAGLEWAYRLAREPRRLWRRYLVRDPRFFQILLAQMVAQRRAAKAGVRGS